MNEMMVLTKLQPTREGELGSEGLPRSGQASGLKERLQSPIELPFEDRENKIIKKLIKNKNLQTSEEDDNGRSLFETSLTLSSPSPPLNKQTPSFFTKLSRASSSKPLN
ncbi:hypothetical protein RIF29_39441 [Crotalaria pallida]|uniref:Uncharacterized protein n=1 Tax=Crotalaria pallida TaxID=3830 RepID=A0AAN9E3N5_CROPI